MKVLPSLFLLIALLTSGCGKSAETLAEEAAAAEAEAGASGTATPRPKQGDWMWKERGNPLEQRPKK